jgi:WD40 repeat protein
MSSQDNRDSHRCQCQDSDPPGHHGQHGLHCPVSESNIRSVSLPQPDATRDKAIRLAAGKTMVMLTHHKKSVRAVAIHPTEYSFATGSAGGNNIKKWKCPEGAFVSNFGGHNAIINTLSVDSKRFFLSGGMLPLAVSVNNLFE